MPRVSTRVEQVEDDGALCWRIWAGRVRIGGKGVTIGGSAGFASGFGAGWSTGNSGGDESEVAVSSSTSIVPARLFLPT